MSVWDSVDVVRLAGQTWKVAVRLMGNMWELEKHRLPPPTMFALTAMPYPV
jgi:hypothetical protein